MTNKCQLFSYKNAQSSKISGCWENNEHASNKRLPEQIFEFVCHELVRAVEVNRSFLPCRAAQSVDSLCHPTCKTGTKCFATFDQRAQEIDEYEREVDVDEDVARQEWDNRVSLQSNTATSV